MGHNMILAYTVIFLAFAFCVYIFTVTIIEIRKLKHKRSEEIESTLYTLESLKYRLEEYGMSEEVNALDFAIKEIEKCS